MYSMISWSVSRTWPSVSMIGVPLNLAFECFISVSRLIRLRISSHTARLRRNQNEKSRIHHEGTKDTKVFVGCASRTGRSRNISRKGAKAQREIIVISNEERNPCFEQSEKSSSQIPRIRSG